MWEPMSPKPIIPLLILTATAILGVIALVVTRLIDGSWAEWIIGWALATCFLCAVGGLVVGLLKILGLLS